jgi:hypothetical protein
VAITVVGWRPGDAELADLGVFGVSMLFSGP